MEGNMDLSVIVSVQLPASGDQLDFMRQQSNFCTSLLEDGPLY
jgi:hypothetical protein